MREIPQAAPITTADTATTSTAGIMKQAPVVAALTIDASLDAEAVATKVNAILTSLKTTANSPMASS